MEVFQAVDNCDKNYFQQHKECINQRSPNNQFTPFLYAAYTGNLEMLKFFYEFNDIDSTAKGPHGMNVVHLAAYADKPEIVKFLNDKSFDFDYYEENGLLPIHIAVRENNYNVVKVILASNSNYANSITFGDSEGHQFTPLHFAVYNDNDNDKLCRLLIYFKADYYKKDRFGNSPYDIAKKLNKTDILKIFDQHQKQIDRYKECQKAILNDNNSKLQELIIINEQIDKELLCKKDPENGGNLLIQYAINTNKFNCIDFLFRVHCFLKIWDLSNFNGETILYTFLQKYYSSTKKEEKNFYFSAIKYLVLNEQIPLGINLSTHELYNYSYFSNALYNKDIELINLLLQRKDLVISKIDLKLVISSVNKNNSYYYYKLLSEMFKRTPSLVNQILDEKGYTALGLAIIYKNHKSIIQLLLNCRADPMEPFSYQNHKPIFYHVICTSNYALMEQIYNTYPNINLNYLDTDNHNSLFYAFFYYDAKIINFLIAHGASAKLIGTEFDDQKIMRHIQKCQAQDHRDFYVINTSDTYI